MSSKFFLPGGDAGFPCTRVTAPTAADLPPLYPRCCTSLRAVHWPLAPGGYRGPDLSPLRLENEFSGSLVTC